uniref:A1 protein n=2 Tax=Viruses TaxID=10239 RepID=A0AAU8GMD6_9CAUD
MIFYPSEAFILGLFIIAAAFILNYTRSILAIIGINNVYAANNFRKNANIQKYMSIILLTIGIVFGFCSSLMPIN